MCVPWGIELHTKWWTHYPRYLYQSTQSPREHTLNDVSVNSIPQGTHTEWCISQLNPTGEHTLNDVSVNSIPQRTHTEWCMSQLNPPGNHTLNDGLSTSHIWTLNVNSILRNGNFAVVLKIFSDNMILFSVWTLMDMAINRLVCCVSHSLYRGRGTETPWTETPAPRPP